MEVRWAGRKSEARSGRYAAEKFAISERVTAVYSKYLDARDHRRSQPMLQPKLLRGAVWALDVE